MKYYLYRFVDCASGKKVLHAVFGGYEELLHFLSRYQWGRKCESSYHNRMLDEQNLSGYDIIPAAADFDGNGNSLYYYRVWQLRDENDRIIDMRNLYDDIVRYAPPPYVPYRERVMKNVRYRIDPVPYTGGSGRRYLRSVHKHHNLKLMSDGMLRKRVCENMPDWWDEPWRKYYKSWKTQGKRRHQWER